MTYQARPNGAHVLICDNGVCSNELLAPDQEQLLEDARVGGWHERDDRHVCADCASGANLFRSIEDAPPMIVAPSDVRAGDSVFDQNGKRVATYKHDARAGESVEVEVFVPMKVSAPVSDRFAQILGRSVVPSPSNPAGYDSLFDDFDDQPVKSGDLLGHLPPAQAVPKIDFGAPGRGQGRLPTATASEADKGHPGIGKRTLESPAGTYGGRGLVQEPPRPRQPPVKIEPLPETSDLFGFLDEGSERTRWDPDGK